MAKFGGFIHTYTINQAVADGAVVPLLYEGRMVEIEQNQAAIDLWFERHTQGLTNGAEGRPEEEVRPRGNARTRPIRSSTCAPSTSASTSARTGRAPDSRRSWSRRPRRRPLKYKAVPRRDRVRHQRGRHLAAR